jgi:prophage antirepressor-like protein
MNTLNTYTYKNKDFYLLDELKTYDPKFFYGCAQMGPEKIINKKSITEYKVVKYTKNKDNEYEWSESTLKYKRCKLFVGVEWAGLNIPKLCGRMEGYKYPDAPPILKLTDKECFKDKDGYILPVEVRGERSEDKVYFKAKDIGKIFEMENLCRAVYNKHNGYQQSEDYVIFSNCAGLTTGESCENKTKPSLFLTYNGLLKVVFLSRSGIAKEFRSWATKVVYTAHIGTTEQREQLSKQIKGGAEPEEVKNVLKCNVTSTPCIYLFCLGGVKDLKENEIFKEVLSNHKNSDKVYKYGRSIDLCRRTGEHRRSWTPLEIKLSKYAYIDPQYTSKVELDLKNYLSNDLECQFLKVKGPDGQTTNEIVVLSNQQLKLLSDKYVDLSKEYGGCLIDITKTNIELERRLETLTMSHDSEMEKLKHKIELVEAKYSHQLDLKDKENEILKLKMELLTISKN